MLNNPSAIFTKLAACSMLVLLVLTTRLNGADRYADNEVIVTFKPNVSEQEVTNFYRAHALKMEARGKLRNDGPAQPWARIGDSTKEKSTEALIQDLSQDDRVLVVEPNYIRHVMVTPDDTYFSSQWALKNAGLSYNGTTGTAGADIEFIAAWQMAAPQDEEIVIAIIDTGLDTAHPDLQPSLWINPGEIADNNIDDDRNGYVDDINGYDFSLDTGLMSDSGTHGTHVAGITGAAGFNGVGIIGVFPGVKILPLKVSTDGDTMLTSSTLEAYSYVADLKRSGVNIVAVNASYGGESSSTAELLAIQELRDAGILFCAAAGNDNINNDRTPSYPANYNISNIISVAATNQNHALADFSNYGVTTVDLAAPGQDIYSAIPTDEATEVADVTARGVTYEANTIEYSGATDESGISGNLVICGLGRTTEFPSAVSGNIALIQRGTLTFNEKVTNAMAAGAIAAIIYDNTTAPLSNESWTLGQSGNWIPAIQVTQQTGQILSAFPLPVALIRNYVDKGGTYEYESGTSMATPMVTAAVAFAYLNFPNETMVQRRSRILNNVETVSALSSRVVSGGVLNLRRIVDTDLDSLPDWWEIAYFSSLSPVPSADIDQDGYNNAEEFLANTHPNNPNSNPSSEAYSFSTSAVQGSASFTIPTFFGRTYSIQMSDDLTPDSWTVLGEPIIGDGSVFEIEDPDAYSVERRFYRLSVTATE